MRWFLTIALVALAACSHKPAAPESSAPPLLIDGRGTTMPLEEAVTHIAFRPYVPAQAIAFAVLPPLGNLDVDKNRGLGIEYVAGHNAMLLSEWPAQRFSIEFGRNGALTRCEPVHYSATAVAWTTPGNLLMTLQPDGTVDPQNVELEARRLVRAEGCR